MRNMEKEKWISLLFLGLFMLPLLVSIVSAATPLQSLQNLFNSSLSTETRGTIAKILFMALIALIVYSIADILPFMPTQNETVKWAIAIIIAVLAFLFVPVGDIQVILTQYEALGIMITSIIPLIILMFFSVRFEAEMKSKGKTPEIIAATKVLNRFLFIGFASYCFWKWGNISSETGIGGIYIISAAIALIWTFWAQKKLFLLFFKEQIEATVSTGLTNAIEALEAEINEREARAQHLSGRSRQSYDAHTEDLRTRLDELKKKLGR